VNDEDRVPADSRYSVKIDLAFACIDQLDRSHAMRCDTRPCAGATIQQAGTCALEQHLRKTKCLRHRKK
jgi:hypothetical protein